MASITMIKAYLQLFRIPNVFTAMADVTVGYLFLNPNLCPAGSFCCLLAASCCLYTAGMVLNDVFDARVDAQQRPQRPIPSGRIGLETARRLGFGLLLIGVLFGWIGGYWVGTHFHIPWRSGAVATLLAVTVVLYDAVLKRTWLAPAFMGACRCLNILLGMSLSPLVANGGNKVLGYTADQLVVAAGIGVFIVGVTWFARSEAVTSRRGGLVLALVVMVAGLALLISFPQWGMFDEGVRKLTMPGTVWLLLIVLLTFSIVRRCAMAILSPQPDHVQFAVKHAIMSLVLLDAAVCLAVREPVWWSVGIVLLLAPMLLLGRWIYST